MSGNYDSLRMVSYTFPGVNFASGSSQKLKIPRGSRMARVCDILVSATVLFTQVTTPAVVQIGDGTTANAFGQLSLGALAAGNTIGASDVLGGLFGVGNQYGNAATAVYLAGNYNSGAGLHDLIATFVAPTGGTPAGTATVIVVVGYDQITP
jgi:hypothetical protein